jgi:hypothetical protein
MRRTTRSGRALGFAAAVALSSGDFAVIRAQSPPSGSIIQISLSPSHEHYRRRIENAANESLARFSEWLGPLPPETIVIADRPDAPSITTPVLELPWRPAPATMDVESQVSYGMAQLWWDHRTGDDEDWAAISGVSWYLQSRVVERLYDFAFLNPGHSSEAVGFFGAAVPWQFPLLRMSRWTSGLGRFEHLRGDARRVWPAQARWLPVGPDAIRIALAFGSLERSVGWPALQGALFEWVHRGRLTSLSSAGLFEVIGAAIGQDVSELFELARDDTKVVDYAVGVLSSVSCPTGRCVTTKVTTERAGNASVPQEIDVTAEFADGQQVDARWDGRAASKDFEFESPVPPVAVHLDPKRIVLLDTNWLNNDRLVSSRTNVPIRKWVARWVVWLQDASLSYASLF